MAGRELIDPASDYVRTKFRNEIAQSDLITIDLGSNDLQLPIIMSLGTVLNPTASEDYKMGLIEQLLRKYGDANEVILKLADSVAKIHGVEFVLETIAKATLTGIHQFNTNYPAIIEKIQDINPTADIYVVGLYNPLTDTQISEELPIKIGKVIDPVILGMNPSITCRHRSRCATASA